MCLGIPGKVVSIGGDALRTARVEFGGIVKQISLAYVPEAREGDYVIVHVGFAISRLREEEALQVFRYIEQLEGPIEGQLAESPEAAS